MAAAAAPHAPDIRSKAALRLRVLRHRPPETLPSSIDSSPYWTSLASLSTSAKLLSAPRLRSAVDEAARAPAAPAMPMARRSPLPRPSLPAHAPPTESRSSPTCRWTLSTRLARSPSDVVVCPSSTRWSINACSSAATSRERSSTLASRRPDLPPSASAGPSSLPCAPRSERAATDARTLPRSSWCSRRPRSSSDTWRESSATALSISSPLGRAGTPR
mmetsp:Transcript_49405/g.141368  ORF Transcript_49405/g.141368 Transcript_49405/m.141368 type:complete len:218 (+) Transcript_49405:792-1445(+)